MAGCHGGHACLPFCSLRLTAIGRLPLELLGLLLDIRLQLVGRKPEMNCLHEQLVDELGQLSRRAPRPTGRPADGLTNTPRPGRLTTQPARSSSRYARAMVFGLTTSSRESSRTEGNLSSGFELAASDRLTNLPAQLLVDGEPAAGIYMKFHGRLNCTVTINTVDAICCQAALARKNQGSGRGRSHRGVARAVAKW